MIRQDKLNAALKAVSAFIDSLTKTEMVSEDLRFHLLFSRADEGTISLDRETTRQYEDCLLALWEAVSSGERISLRAVEGLFQDAIFDAVDIRKKREREMDARLNRALQELRLRLTAVPQRFLVYCPVNGLARQGLPSRVGNIEFVVFGKEQLDQIRDAVATHSVDQEQQDSRREMLATLGQESTLVGHVAGAAEVTALEGKAAESIAIKELRLTIDVVNFYSDLIPYNHAHLSLPGDADAARLVIPQLVLEGSQRSSFSVNHTSWGRLGELPLPKLWDWDLERNLGFSRVAKLLCVQRNDLEDNVIASMQWAGRATTEIRKETAFLLYAIALETIVLSDKSPIELTYRLGMRTAHLLAGDVASRRIVFSKLGKLYDIRSKIVHNGRYQVTDADLSLLRNITKSALIRICTGSEFCSMSSGKELGEWFQERLLE